MDTQATVGATAKSITKPVSFRFQAPHEPVPSVLSVFATHQKYGDNRENRPPHLTEGPLG
jgi:hypothetical protein